ncbi:phytoene/squalene synthase family protein [Corynebacterium sp. TAE3-ERU12]|uniref:phytoene/squalene synthase family protein n=1 Tax=Corynebacterium sp. TAE3-ERU12 TaxID=2849491 RepID=UPI001C43F42F|nr:phytoene/squalene synthase family protein [Corynebacterium sp. TAE3-ERU12]MBV7296239.1 phytoene/squalene synthase family protein [Corynebacterium sp. TAE3-ERU12]
MHRNDAAEPAITGIAPEQLAAARQLCHTISAGHGRTYSLAARLLTPEQRTAVWCLYAWARTVDDVVDIEGPVNDPADTEDHVHRLQSALIDFINHNPPAEPTPETPPESTLSQQEWSIAAATADTIVRWDIQPDLFADFARCMLMDVPGATGHRAHFATWEQLTEYMWGSAAVIGLQMLPVLGTTTAPEEAKPYAIALGNAFQVTNFLRDVAEDLRRGRIYLPTDEWAAFGVDPEMLHQCAQRGHATKEITAAMRHFAAVNRSMYRDADPGVQLLSGPARPAIRTARILYGDILERIAAQGHDPFVGRAVVPTRRRLAIAIPYGAAAIGQAALTSARAVLR